MELVNKLKSFFCNHDYTISDIRPLERKGTFIITLLCKKCNQNMNTFHDFTETEDRMFRNPIVERLLIKEGLLKMEKNGKYGLSFQKSTIEFAK